MKVVVALVLLLVGISSSLTINREGKVWWQLCWSKTQNWMNEWILSIKKKHSLQFEILMDSLLSQVDFLFSCSLPWDSSLWGATSTNYAHNFVTLMSQYFILNIMRETTTSFVTYKFSKGLYIISMSIVYNYLRNTGSNLTVFHCLAA